VPLIKQRLGLLQIERVEAFGEPTVERGGKIVSPIARALIAASRAMLIAMRSSQEFARCWRATAGERSKYDSAV
jgi:hypothetical protein